VEVSAASVVEVLVAAVLAEAGKLRQAQQPFDKRSTELMLKSQYSVAKLGANYPLPLVLTNGH
jgi:hypothetical protein